MELYHRADSIDAETRKLWGAFLPVLVVMLFALAAIQLPLAVLYTRRVRQHERERERLVRRADDRVEAERLRIAAELHDGVVQDLVGVAYELHAVADELPEDPHAAPGQGLGDILRRSEQSCRTAVRALRSLLLELHPSERRAETLEAALARLAEPLRERGVAVPIEVRLRRIPPVDVSELVHRAVQEALRNVDRHAGARSAEVTLTDDGSAIRLCVHDDGARDDRHRPRGAARRRAHGPAPARRRDRRARRVAGDRVRAGHGHAADALAPLGLSLRLLLRQLEVAAGEREQTGSPSRAAMVSGTAGSRVAKSAEATVRPPKARASASTASARWATAPSGAASSPASGSACSAVLGVGRRSGSGAAATPGWGRRPAPRPAR